MKALWFSDMSLWVIFPNLLVKTLEKILKIQLMRLIGLKFFISLASSTFGMRVNIAKFSL
jgi:hypothetical protein